MPSRYTLSKILTIAALALFAGAELSAQAWAGRGRVHGTIEDPDGNPVAGATLTLVHQEMEAGPPSLTSDRRGRFTYLGLNTGRWEITIEAEGFQTLIVETDVAQLEQRPPLEIVLDPLPEEYYVQQRLMEAQEWIDRGNAHMEAGEFAEAREEFREAAKIVDDEFKPLIMLGVARAGYAAGDVEGALATLAEIREMDPQNRDALNLSIDILAAEGRSAEAEALMAEAGDVEVDPVTSVNLGIEAFNANQYASAQRYFEQALAGDPELAEAHYLLGMAHLAQERVEEAKERFQRVLEIDPDGPRAEDARQMLDALGEG
jgi:tetratricopeptide (TPR) repeat protein